MGPSTAVRLGRVGAGLLVSGAGGGGLGSCIVNHGLGWVWVGASPISRRINNYSSSLYSVAIKGLFATVVYPHISLFGIFLTLLLVLMLFLSISM